MEEFDEDISPIKMAIIEPTNEEEEPQFIHKASNEFILNALVAHNEDDDDLSLRSQTSASSD